MKKSIFSLCLSINLILSCNIFAGGELYLKSATQFLDDEMETQVAAYGKPHPISHEAAALSTVLKNALLDDKWKPGHVIPVPDATDSSLSCLIRLLETTVPFLESNQGAARVVAEENDLLWNQAHRKQLIKVLEKCGLQTSMLQACEYLDCRWLLPVIAQYLVSTTDFQDKETFGEFITDFIRKIPDEFSVLRSILQNQSKKFWYLLKENEDMPSDCEFDLEELIDCRKVEIEKKDPRLSLSGLQINRLSSGTGISKLSTLFSLDLSKNKLTRAVSPISELRNLEILDLANNQLGQFPSGISNLTNLIFLKLSKNQIKELPAEISRLAQLWVLKLYKNKLEKLAPEIWNLTNLERLDIAANKLEEIPSGISELRKLNTLCLSHNPLGTLPPGISSLTRLSRLFLSGIQLSAWPSEIRSLTKLQILDLSQNQIVEIFPEIGALRNLVSLDLSKNPLGKDTKQVLRQALPNTNLKFLRICM